MRRKACSLCFANCVKLHGHAEDQEDAIPSHSPSFLKKIAASTRTSTMHIPSSFVKAHARRLSKAVTLEGPSREKWSVEVGGSFEKFAVDLRGGWTKFVTDHFLQIGDQLLFSLTADSYFQVEVYDESGCQKLSALDAINTTTPLESSPTTLESNPSPEEPKAKKAKSEDHEKVRSSPALRLVGRKKKERNHPDKSTPSAKKLLIDLESSQSDLGDTAVSGDDFEVVKPGILEDPAREAGDLLPQQKMVNGVVISRRRPVTEDEKLQALQSAQSLDLDNPNTTIVMTRAHVYKGFLLIFPKQFARESMPPESREVTLVNMAGSKWPVKWLQKDTGFSGGWRRFSLDHRLEEFDVCMFEIIDKKDFVLLVHIFRVVGGQAEDVAAYGPSSAKIQKTDGAKVKKRQDFYQDDEEQDFSFFHKSRARRTPVRTAVKKNLKLNRDSQGNKDATVSKAGQPESGAGGSVQKEKSDEGTRDVEGETTAEARPKGLSMFEKVGHGFLRHQFCIDGSMEYPLRDGSKEKKASRLASCSAENNLNELLPSMELHTGKTDVFEASEIGNCPLKSKLSISSSKKINESTGNNDSSSAQVEDL